MLHILQYINVVHFDIIAIFNIVFCDLGFMDGAIFDRDYFIVPFLECL